MKDNDEIYGLKCYFSILKNNDFFSESERSYAMRNCAIIKKKINKNKPEKPINWIQTSQRNSGQAKLKKNTTKAKHCICLWKFMI